jgi:hypothetical protein
MFAHKLVRYGIGGRTVAELDECMSTDEFLRWMAFFSLEPFGDDRADWHNAMILAQTYNMNRKKGKRPMTPDKFRLQFKHVTTPAQPIEQMELALRARFTAMSRKHVN